MNRTPGAGVNRLRALQGCGQSIWLDYIRRSFITSGDLKRLVEEDGLGGVTSNPTIFDKAIAGSDDYDDGLRRTLSAEPRIETRTLFERLAVEDVQMAADVLRPVYDRTEGGDGFVSIEVSPQLADDTAGTMNEARRLWKAVGRPNLMVKVPATKEGLPAIEGLLAEGLNINITLMFSLAHYEAVVQAFLRGMAKAADPRRVASVASFFVSRVDTKVDRALDTIGTPEAKALRGKAAVANARHVYRRFREIFYGEPFAALKKKGARVQRPLWASTSTKDPAYSDVLYVEELIGPDTINTTPPSTLNAFRDHGEVRPTLETGQAEAEEALGRLARLGIDLGTVGEELLNEGVAAFAESYDKLMQSLDEKRRRLQLGRLDPQTLALGAFQGAVDRRVGAWREASLPRRLWARDSTIWSATPVPEITDRLGWLTLPEVMHDQLPDLLAFGDEVRREGFRHAVLLGMGGSSLAPEVFQRTFGNAPGHPELLVLDSTHPAAVSATDAAVDLRRTLFLVSSKSGTTQETLSFFRYFWRRVGQTIGECRSRFVAITDPGTPLERLARERSFRRIFSATPDVGGRYSALTAFGLVPAALVGAPVPAVLDSAWRMAEASASCVAAALNPGLLLGAVLGELGQAGRDKITLVASPSLASFPSWLEQLIAESTGKDHKGLVPVADEPLAAPDRYQADRLFVSLELEADDRKAIDRQMSALGTTGHPVVRIRVGDRTDLGQEFFRWELAVAAAGAVLGIQPFNQPDVELAKQLARQAMAAPAGGGASVEEAIASRPDSLAPALTAWLTSVRPGDYLALQAYLAPSKEISALVEDLRAALRQRTLAATTLGYGPRFLHSTGQLHKGGPATGLFLQLVDEPAADIPVPETAYTFGQLIRAQAVGDYQALKQRGRRVLRVQLGRDVTAGLAALRKAID
jgi:transaldolase/glucose-6-phosphate isomerase